MWILGSQRPNQTPEQEFTELAIVVSYHNHRHRGIVFVSLEKNNASKKITAGWLESAIFEGVYFTNNDIFER